VGILTKGQVNISPLKLQLGGLSMKDLSKAANRYKPSDNPSVGWGSLYDDPVHAQRESLRYPFESSVPGATENHRGTEVLRMRYYFEEPNPTLRRVLGEVADRKQYCERHGVDMLFLREEDSQSVTVLVSTTNSSEIKAVVKPALDTLVGAVGEGSGMATDYANTDELDPDIFLWLLYKEAHDRQISPEIKLSEIARMESRNGPIWRSRFSKGATVDRADILALIAKGNTVFGPAKFSFVHSGYPQGFFEISLSADLSFGILRTSMYDEPDLESLPEMEIGPRMVEDLWQVLIPAVRRAHTGDRAWHAEKRGEFVDECRNAVHSI
jgi:hypothetical protein